MPNVYDEQFFKKMSSKEVNDWIKRNYKLLIGSAIFTKNNSLTSKVVSWAESWGKKNKEQFIPSHTGSIVEKEGKLYVFHMKPIKAFIQPLDEYLLKTNDIYKVVLRTFQIDTFMFSQNILFHDGEFYPFLSAIRSVFTKWKTKYRMHCSELHARMIDLSGGKIFSHFNFECTPQELLEYLLNI